MLQLLRNKKGQNTAEYALLIALVVAGIIAMQTYAQRSLQARVKDAGTFMTGAKGNGSVIGTTQQYEPYYQQSQYDVDKASDEVTMQGKGLEGKSESTNRVRQADGFQRTTYGNATENSQ